MKEYANAGHSFLNNHEGLHDKMPFFVVAMGKVVMKSGYREDDARDARGRIVSFFNDHLRQNDLATG